MKKIYTFKKHFDSDTSQRCAILLWSVDNIPGFGIAVLYQG